jgi:hypothetical protein
MSLLRRSFHAIAAPLLIGSTLLLLAGPAAAATSQNFVYVNDDNAVTCCSGPLANTVSGWAVGSGGSLTLIPGSPFATGGKGGGGDTITDHLIVSIGNYLYASNAGDSTISVFSINPSSGVLAPISGSPFAFPFSNGSIAGISIAPALNGSYLVAIGHGGIASYQINGDGSLTEKNSLSVGANGALALQINGSYGAFNSYIVQTFSIASDGTLALGSQLNPAGADVIFNSAGNLLYSVSPGAVFIWTVDGSGNLTPVTNFDPFTDSSNSAGSTSALTPDGKFLFSGSAWYGDGYTVGSFAIASDGTVSVVSGSPFSVSGIEAPEGLAVTADGQYIFVGHYTHDPTTTNGLALLSNNAGTLTQTATVTNVSPSGVSVAVYPNWAAIFLNVTGGTFQYDGSSHPATVTVTPTGIPCNLSMTYNGSSTVPVNAGPYAVAATCTNWSNGHGSSTITINKVPLTAAANNATMLDGAALPTLTGTLTGVIPGDGLTASYTTAATSSSPAGTYPITPVFSDPNNKLGNYSILTSGTLTVEDFSFTGGSGTATLTSVMPGSKATYTVQFTPLGSSTFFSPVTLTLTGLPAGATYTITPSVIPAGSGTTPVTVTVNTSKTSASLSFPKSGIGFPKPLMLAVFLPLLGTRKLRRAMRLQMKTSALTLLVLAVLMVSGMTACGNGSGFFPAPQTYPMTLTGTSGALHHSVTLNLTVQ